MILEGISNVSVTGRVDGSDLEWSEGLDRWEATPHRTPGFIYLSNLPSGNPAGGSFGDLHSYALPANTLPRDGDRLSIVSVFTASGAYSEQGEKRIRAYLGSSLVYDVSVFNAWNNFARPVNVLVSLDVARNSATGQRVTARTQHDEYSPAPWANVPASTGLSLDLTAAQTIRFSVSGFTPNSVTQRNLSVEFVPAL